MKKSESKPSKYHTISVIIILPLISIVWMIGWTLHYIGSPKTMQKTSMKRQLKLQTKNQQENYELNTESQILA